MLTLSSFYGLGMLLVLCSVVLLICLALLLKTCCLKHCENKNRITQEEVVLPSDELTPSHGRTVVVSVITALPPPQPTAPTVAITTARINEAFVDLPPSYEEAIKLPPTQRHQPPT